MQPYGNIPCSELKLLLADTTMDLVVGADDNSAAAASSGQSSEKPAAAQPKRTRKETKKDEIAHARSLVGKIVRLGGIDGVVQQVLSAPKEAAPEPQNKRMRIAAAELQVKIVSPFGPPTIVPAAEAAAAALNEHDSCALREFLVAIRGQVISAATALPSLAAC